MIFNAPNLATVPAEVRQTMPWRHQTYRNGLIALVDRNGKEVPMQTMLTVMELTSVDLALPA